ncbi:MAG: carboxylate--amine ligase, partial [bacterium]|nr:carboxylate--amine ligase [bacterium]
MQNSKKPPVIILGGAANALSVARALGKRGIDIYTSVTAGENPALFTKYNKKLYPIIDKNFSGEFWSDLLLRNTHPYLHGSIIFPCNDDGVEYVADNREELSKYYILDESEPEISHIMLNKRKTLELADRMGIPIPKFVCIESAEDINDIEPDIRFPLIVKPQHSHLFQKAFVGKKL